MSGHTHWMVAFAAKTASRGMFTGSMDIIAPDHLPWPLTTGIWDVMADKTADLVAEKEGEPVLDFTMLAATPLADS